MVNYSSLAGSACAVPSNQFELAFKMMDNDGDGNLDSAEFQQVPPRLSPRRGCRQSSALFSSPRAARVIDTITGVMMTVPPSLSQVLAMMRALHPQGQQVSCRTSARHGLRFGHC
jgi:hypothetical protein